MREQKSFQFLFKSHQTDSRCPNVRREWVPGGRTGYSTHVDRESERNTQELESHRKQQNADTIDRWRWRLECSNWRDTMAWHYFDIETPGRTVWIESSMQRSANGVDLSIRWLTWSLYWSWNMSRAAARITPSNRQSSVLGRPDNRLLQ